MPTIFPPDDYGGFDYIPSDCWKEHGIASVLIAAGLEKVWAVIDMLGDDSNIKATLVYSRMNGGTRAHFTSQAETRLKAEALACRPSYENRSPNNSKIVKKTFH